MATFPSLTEETSLAAGDFLVGYLAAGAPGDDRRWSAATLAQGLSQLNTPTWNDAGTVFNGIKLNVTDTASHAGSKLMDLQVGGSSKFNVDSVGTATSAYGFQSGRNSTGGVMLGNAYGFYGLGMGSQGRVAWGPASPFASPDLVVLRDAAGTLGQRNGVNAQTSNIYNTYTSATEYERAHIGWNDTADTFVIGTEVAGAGVARGINVEPGGALKFKAATGNQLTLGANGSYTWQLTTGHAFGPTGNNVRDLASALIRVKSAYLGTTLDIAQGTLTDDAQALDITSEWNDAADTFTLIKADVTNTASAAGSKLIDLQVGGASKFNVNSEGTANVAGSVNFAGDLLLTRDAANTLAQRNGVNAQTYNIYNTDDGAGNYERGFLKWDAEKLKIGVEKGGTGSPRSMEFHVDANRVLSLASSFCQIDRDVYIMADIVHLGTDVGLYGATPVPQAAHIADATNATDVITRVNAILVALENIGITAAS